MCAASLGAKETLTDLPDILPLLRWNVEANPQVSSNCTVEPLSWLVALRYILLLNLTKLARLGG